MRKTAIMILALMLAFSFTGCKEPDKLAYGKPVKRPEAVDISEQNEIVTDFAVRLLQNTFTGEENVLLSPVSILSGLSLIANGAEGESLSQIEAAVGMSAEEMNAYLYSYTHQLSENWDMDNKLHIANSLWINKDKNITVSDEFLKKNEMYHDASIFYTEFDQSCVEDTNKWIREQTDGKVDEIMNEIPEDVGMYLANSLVYEGVWPEKVYSNKEENFGISFDSISSGNKGLTIIQEREHFYLEDTSACGFMKYLEHGKYAFAALIPDENTDIQTYVQHLSGKRLRTILSNPEHKEYEVGIWMPQFSYDYEQDVVDVLMRMGIREVFDREIAEFSIFCIERGEEALYVEQFKHAASINVNAHGVNTDRRLSYSLKSMYSARFELGSSYSVYLNRPFLIAIIDCEHNVPLLLGVVNNI